jgi:hypothetical protein
MLLWWLVRTERWETQFLPHLINHDPDWWWILRLRNGPKVKKGMRQVSVFYTLWKQKNYVTTSTVVKDNTGGQQHRETTNKTGQLVDVFFRPFGPIHSWLQFQSLQTQAGWWFGTFGWFFPYVGNNNPNWLIFFRGLKPPTRLQNITNPSQVWTQAVVVDTTIS